MGATPHEQTRSQAGQGDDRGRRRPADAEVAARIAHSIGPAFDGFAPIAGTLPMDLEPATFLLVQNAEASK